MRTGLWLYGHSLIPKGKVQPSTPKTRVLRCRRIASPVLASDLAALAEGDRLIETCGPERGFSRSPSSALLPFLVGRFGSPTKIDYKKKQVPFYLNLSTRGPSFVWAGYLFLPSGVAREPSRFDSTRIRRIQSEKNPGLRLAGKIQRLRNSKKPEISKMGCPIGQWKRAQDPQNSPQLFDFRATANLRHRRLNGTEG